MAQFNVVIYFCIYEYTPILGHLFAIKSSYLDEITHNANTKNKQINTNRALRDPSLISMALTEKMRRIRCRPHTIDAMALSHINVVRAVSMTVCQTLVAKHRSTAHLYSIRQSR